MECIRTTDWSDVRTDSMKNPWVYLRFHGPDALARKYWGEYGPDRLGPVANRLRTWLDEGTDVYAYFNNDYHGHAVRDALWLRAALADRPTAAQKRRRRR
jgi:uncharacterized protein YecE (DUF72 family)